MVDAQAWTTLASTVDGWGRILLLQDHNTRVVVLGSAALGVACGVVGTFLLLRRRALLGDALAHAALPGIALAFLVAERAGRSGKNVVTLLIGAAVTGTLGVLAVEAIRRFTRLREDAALAVVLSVFFGLGIALLGIVQSTSTGHAAGLESFIYGKTASMVSEDAIALAVAALVVTVIAAALFKEMRLLCFDASFARGQGWPVWALDLALMAMVIAVVVIGLQAVGLILVIALLVIPPAAARFWTEGLRAMAVTAAAIGAASGAVGALLTAAVDRVPSGAAIVLVAAACFLCSMVFGVRRGILPERWRRRSIAAAMRESAA